MSPCGTAGGDVTSPRSAVRRRTPREASPAPRALRRLCFLGLQQIPDEEGALEAKDPVLSPARTLEDSQEQAEIQDAPGPGMDTNPRIR